MSKRNARNNQADALDATQANDVRQGVDASESDPSGTMKRPRMRVNYQHGLNLRAGPGRQHPILGILFFGTEVEVTGEAVSAGDTQWVPAAGGWLDSAYLEPVGAEV